MKSIFITFLFLSLFPFYLIAQDINEFQTDVYFTNGVWNTKKQAEESLGEMIEFFEQEINENIISQAPFQYKLAYNWTGKTEDGATDYGYDIIETFYILKNNNQENISEQVTLIEYLRYQYQKSNGAQLIVKMYEWLSKSNINITIAAQQQDLKYSTEANIKDMVEKYKSESLNKYHKILGIAHSEGNLFMNEVSKSLNTPYFKIIGVGVPADNVQEIFEGNNPTYVTLDCDQVIKYIGGALPTNTICNPGDDLSGHEFVDSYLKQINSRNKLATLIHNSLVELSEKPSQFALSNSICQNTNIMVRDASSKEFTISYVLDKNGSVYDVNGSLVMSDKYEHNLSGFKEMTQTKGYLTLIENQNYFLLRASVPVYGAELHTELNLHFTSENIATIFDKQVRLFKTSGVNAEQDYYMSSNAANLSINNASLHSNLTYLPLKKEINTGLQAIDVASLREIYRDDTYIEFELGYCYNGGY